MQKKASATLLYRNPSPPEPPPSLFSPPTPPRNCTDFCLNIDDHLGLVNMEFNSKFRQLSVELGRMRNNTALVENLQVETMLDALSAIAGMRFSVVQLHFGCTTRAFGNNADMSRIVTDMQTFNCSNMPSTGDEPGESPHDCFPLVITVL